MGSVSLSSRIAVLLFVLAVVQSCLTFVHGDNIKTTDDFQCPVTVNIRGLVDPIDLPYYDPLVQRNVTGWEPEQISVSLSTDYDSVWISWVTGEYRISNYLEEYDPNSVGSLVRYGESRQALNHTANGHSLVYSQRYEPPALLNYSSGIIHHVRLTGLEPNTVYYYECGDPKKGAMSEVYWFRTMPVSGPRSYPSKIGVVGDLGLSYNTTTTIDHLIKNDPALILLLGDVTYADLYYAHGADCEKCDINGVRVNETFQPRWDFWARYMQRVVSKVPLMVIEGNHEYEKQVGDQTFVAYSARFAFPSNESGSNTAMYYSFNAGGIHFVMLSGYIDYDRSGDQYKWLEKDLAKVDRKKTPWLVAAMHPTWYGTYVKHYREAECMRMEMEDLLYKHKVDIVLSGHVHAYERSNRVYNYTLDHCGPVHIIVGDGGNREDRSTTFADEPGLCPKRPKERDLAGRKCSFKFTSGPAKGEYCWNRQPEYSAYRESSYGHGILETKNETHALWTWYRNVVDKNTTYPADRVYIVRHPERCHVQPEVLN
ncbi:hypothetical protein PTKIN_Ptkin09bG0229000 [Pterospermum kingtungense]